MRTVLIAALIVAASSCGPADENENDFIAAETSTIANAVSQLQSDAGGDVEYSIWLGQADGKTWYHYQSDTIRPAASAIKTAVLVEFLSTQIDSLDEPFDALNEIVGNPDSPAIRHFDEEQKASVQDELSELTARQLAEAMISKKHVGTNAAYNAAANVIIEYLGGPRALTERLKQRFPTAKDLQLARYMLADRQDNDDNLLTAEALAIVLRFLAQGEPFDEVRSAAREILLLETDPDRGEHFYKGGSLRSDPQVRIEAGWWDSRGATCVYVVVGTRPTTAKSEEDYEKLRSDLGGLSRVVQDVGIRIRDAARR